MHVSVLFFARAREVADTDRIEVRRDDGSITTSYVVAEVVRRFPAMEGVLKTCVLAINQEYAEHGDDRELADGDEIAIIPPLSGG